MPHGGKRSGSGRPTGARSARARATAKLIVESGKSPLEYMRSLMEDETASVERRDWAASQMLPYAHAKLGSQSTILAAAVAAQDVTLRFVSCGQAEAIEYHSAGPTI